MTTPADRLLHCVRRIASQLGPEPDDSLLLSRFLTDRDPVAFEALVIRHGPMVLRVCQHVLGNRHDAEDAFQATFLVLAKKAAHIRPPGCLAGWLHGVACRVSLGARSTARRRRRESLASDLAPLDPHPDPLAELTAREELRILEEEVQRLPEVYRLPVVLCCLHGATQEDAARQLGWSPGSAKGRLERGRKRLHRRLVGRGLELGAALALADLSRGTMAGPTAALAEDTAKASLALAARGLAGAGFISGKVAALARVKLGLLLLVGTVVTSGLATSVYRRSAGESPQTTQLAAEQGETAPDVAMPKASSDKTQARTDRYGIPLPKGAIMRLGCGSFALPHSLSLAFSPGGKFLVSTAYSDKLIRLWDPDTGRELHALGGHTSDNIRLAFSADGKWLASSSQNRDFAFSADHKWRASSSQNHEIIFWDFGARKIRRLFPGSNAQLHGLALSPNGKILASTSSGETLRLWDTDTGKEIHSLPVEKEYGVYAMTFAPDSKHFAYSDRYDKGIHLVDVATGKTIREFKGHTFEIGQLAFTADGATLLSSCAAGSADHTLCAWDVASGKERRRYGDEKECVYRLAVSPDQKTLAYGTGRLVHFRDLVTDKDVLPPWNASPGDVQSLAFSPDGKKLAVGGLRIAILDMTTGKQLNPDPESLFHVRQIEYAAKGKVLAVLRDNHTIELWDTAKGRKVTTVRLEHERDQFASMACSPDGNSLTTAIRHCTQGKEDGSICHWDPMTGKKQQEFPETGCRFESLSYTADGKTLGYYRVGLQGGSGFVFWDTAEGKERRRIQAPHHHPMERDLRLSPDGRLLAQGGMVRSVQLWDTKRGELLHSFGDRHPRFPPVLPAFSPDGRTIAAPGGQRREGQIQIEPDIVLWELSTRKERLHIAPNEGQVSQIAFSPNGRLLATAGQWETIHLWDAWTGKEVGRFAGHRGRIHSLSFAPDGKTLASAGADKTILIWDVSGFAPATRPMVEKLSREQLARCWDHLLGENAMRAYAAMAELSGHPAQVESFLEDKLMAGCNQILWGCFGWGPGPGRRTPRKLGYTLMAHPGMDADRLARLIADLDDDAFKTRESASKELAKLGRRAAGALKKTLDENPSEEVKRRIQNLLDKLDAKEDRPERLRLLRVIEVLERLGTPQARRLLRKLVQETSDSNVVREAEASSERLGKAARGVP